MNTKELKFNQKIVATLFQTSTSCAGTVVIAFRLADPAWITSFQTLATTRDLLSSLVL
jgi:hypothetical protein